VNRFVRGWVGRGSALGGIEVHRTACIVTHPPGGELNNHALVNPANESLAGTRFTPDECWRNLHGDPTTGRWSEDFAVYPTQVVDGLVTEFGGEALRVVLESQPADAQGRRCPVGNAVVTPALHELRELYGSLVHAVPPFRRGLDPSVWSDQLVATYHAAFDAACRNGLTTLAVPLLGAGARGALKGEAMAVAAKAAVTWRMQDPGPREAAPIARFGVQDSTTAHRLIDALKDAMRDSSADCGEGFDEQEPPTAERWTVP